MDLLRLGVVYVHLIACCAAIGLVLSSDLALIARLVRVDALEDRAQNHPLVQRTVTIALAVLWLSGAVLIAIDTRQAGLDYYANPKLQAKIVIVSLLTLNGVFLHNAVFPALRRAGSLVRMPLLPMTAAVLAGSVSAVSWFYAAMLGVGRALSWRYSLMELLALYPVLIAGSANAMLMLTLWSAAQRTAAPGRAHDFNRLTPTPQAAGASLRRT